MNIWYTISKLSGPVFLIAMCAVIVLGALLFIERQEEKLDKVQALIAERDARRTKGLYENLHYFRDPKTGLCFTGWIRGTATSLAHIPCEALDKLEESK